MWASPTSPASSVSSGFSVIAFKSPTISEVDYELVETLQSATMEEPMSELKLLKKKIEQLEQENQWLKIKLEETEKNDLPVAVQFKFEHFLAGSAEQDIELQMKHNLLEQKYADLETRFKLFTTGDPFIADPTPIQLAINGHWRLRTIMVFTLSPPNIFELTSTWPPEKFWLLYHRLEGNLLTSHITCGGVISDEAKQSIRNASQHAINDSNQLVHEVLDPLTGLPRYCARFVQEGNLHAQLEFGGGSSMRFVYERFEDDELPKMRAAIGGKWRMLYSGDHIRMNVATEKRVDSYTWHTDDTLTWESSIGKRWTRTINATECTEEGETRTYVQGSRLITTCHLKREFVLAEHFLVGNLLYVTHKFTDTGYEFRSVFARDTDEN